MAILQITTDFPGQVGVFPRLVRVLSDDDYATVTAAGYLNSAAGMGVTILPTDFIFASYSDGFGSFNPTISGSNITLVPTPDNGGFTGSAVVGHFATFSTTEGQINDDGYLPSDATKTVVAMVDGATVINNLATFNDITGTVQDAGARIIANTTAAYAGGGTSNTFVATGLTVGAKGSAVIRASTNSVSITKALPGTNTLAITFSADPGASTTVDYIYSTASLT